MTMTETKQLRRNNLMDIKEQLVEVRAYLDQELHPLVSPDHWDIYSNLCDMIDNISILLKEQEPRVLTLEEVMQYIGYSAKIPPKEWEKLPLWTESKNGTGVISGYRDVENLRYLIDMGGRDVTYIAYKHWRCWSARPTDEQRKAVKWDG